MSKNYKTIYKSFLGSLIKKGQKQKTKLILDSSLKETSNLLKAPVDLVLVKLLLNLNCFVESKIINVRKNRYIIPFPLRSKRQNFLKLKWILKSVKASASRESFNHKLTKEFVNIIQKRSAPSLSIRSDNLNISLKNRSNMHFRW